MVGSIGVPDWIIISAFALVVVGLTRIIYPGQSLAEAIRGLKRQ